MVLGPLALECPVALPGRKSTPKSGRYSERARITGCDAGPVRERIMYVELKTDQNDRGPAWIGRVRLSKTGRTVYTRGLTLERSNGVEGNFADVVTGDEYWVSGVKRNRHDRHWAGSGPVEIDDDAREEYERLVGGRG